MKSLPAHLTIIEMYLCRLCNPIQVSLPRKFYTNEDSHFSLSLPSSAFFNFLFKIFDDSFQFCPYILSYIPHFFLFHFSEICYLIWSLPIVFLNLILKFLGTVFFPRHSASTSSWLLFKFTYTISSSSCPIYSVIFPIFFLVLVFPWSKANQAPDSNPDSPCSCTCIHFPFPTFQF